MIYGVYIRFWPTLKTYATAMLAFTNIVMNDNNEARPSFTWFG